MTFSELLKQANSINSMLSSCEIPCNVESIELLSDPLRVEVKTEQKKIDDKELDTIKEFYHQIGYEYAIEYAVEWLKEHPYAFTLPQGEVNFRKAMEE